MAFDPISAALQIGDSIIKRIWPDPSEQAKAKLEMLRLYESGELQAMVSAAGIVKSEAESEHWLTANWRPLTMITFVFIIANNYIVAPYAGAIFGAHASVSLPIPPDLWQLLKIGLGGYVVGRSAEKGIRLWKAKADTD